MKTSLSSTSIKASSVLALALLLAMPGEASSFFTNMPVADTFVTTGSTGNLSGFNFGGAGALAIAVPGLSKGEFQSVVRYDLAGARSAFDSQFGPGKWTLQSVTLRLYTANSVGNPIFNNSHAGQFGVSWMQNDSWVEGSGIPRNMTTDGISFASLTNLFMSVGDENLGTLSYNGLVPPYDGGPNQIATYTLSLTPGFSADVTAGNNVSLRLFAVDSSVSYIFHQRSYGGEDALLTVEAVQTVPEPGPFALGLIGVASAAFVARWRNRGCI